MRKLALLLAIGATLAAPASAEATAPAAVKFCTIQTLLRLDGGNTTTAIAQVRLLLTMAPVIGTRSETETVALAVRLGGDTPFVRAVATAAWELLHC